MQSDECHFIIRPALTRRAVHKFLLHDFREMKLIFSLRCSSQSRLHNSSQMIQKNRFGEFVICVRFPIFRMLCGTFYEEDTEYRTHIAFSIGWNSYF